MNIYLARSRDVVDAAHSRFVHVCFSDILANSERIGTPYPMVLYPVTFCVSTRRQYVRITGKMLQNHHFLQIRTFSLLAFTS